LQLGKEAEAEKNALERAHPEGDGLPPPRKRLSVRESAQLAPPDGPVVPAVLLGKAEAFSELIPREALSVAHGRRTEPRCEPLWTAAAPCSPVADPAEIEPATATYGMAESPHARDACTDELCSVASAMTPEPDAVTDSGAECPHARDACLDWLGLIVSATTPLPDDAT
jgi:hypothetical protein